MKRIIAGVIIFFILLLPASLCFGIYIGQMTYGPKTITEYKTWTQTVEHTVFVPIEKIIEVKVYPTEFRQFKSQEELSKWQAKQYLELQELGRQNSWTCVDYASEMQRRAWLDGYQMSNENLIDKGGRTGHAICSTWIGDKCIYLEPQETKSWVGALKG